jgi:AI-2 transport protein TqsA
LAVIFAVFFWSFMWGIAGAFIGVPILIAALVYCDKAAPTRWLAALFVDDDFADVAVPARQA